MIFIIFGSIKIVVKERLLTIKNKFAYNILNLLIRQL